MQRQNEIPNSWDVMLNNFAYVRKPWMILQVHEDKQKTSIFSKLISAGILPINENFSALKDDILYEIVF